MYGVISNAIAHWPALKLWSDPAYLTEALSNDLVSLQLTPNGCADAVTLIHDKETTGDLCFASAHVEKLPFPEALQAVRSWSKKKSVAYLQQQNDCFRTEYSTIASDCDDDIAWQKHFILLPPTDVHRLYVQQYPASNYSYHRDTEEFKLELEQPMRHVPWCSVDPCPSPEKDASERLKYPFFFIDPKPFHCTVKAGDILYLPSMWFHHVSQTPGDGGYTIAVNYWYDTQLDVKYVYFNFLQSVSYKSSSLDPSLSWNEDEDSEYSDAEESRLRRILYCEEESMRSLDAVRKMCYPNKIFMRSQVGLNTTKIIKYGGGDDPQWLQNQVSEDLTMSLNNLTLHLPKYNSLAEARGKIYFMAKDQHGSRFLQRKFAEKDADDIDMILSEIIDYVSELMIDPFGNYLVQKLLEVCSEDQRMQIILSIARKPGVLIKISCDMHGQELFKRSLKRLRDQRRYRSLFPL